MRARNLVAAMALAAGIAGCAATAPSPTWLPDRADVAGTPYGAFAVLRVQESKRVEGTLSGELIAIEADTTYLLPEDPSRGLVAVANVHIRSLVVRDHQPPGGVRGYSETALTRGVGSYALTKSQAHARFPQGLPQDLDRSSLRSPWAKSSQ